MRLLGWFCCATFIWVIAAGAFKSEGQALKREHQDSLDTVNTVHTVKDVLKGSIISSEQLVEYPLERSRLSSASRPILSAKQAIGKVAKRDLSSGTILSEQDIRLPNMPTPGADWLFDFPSAKLFAHLGKRISVKGHWIMAADGYAVMDYAANGKVFLGKTYAEAAALPVANFHDDQCVMAAGVLRQSRNHKSYYLEPSTVVLKASEW